MKYLCVALWGLLTIQSALGQSLDDKIGQMLIIGFRGTEVTSQNPIYNDIKDLNIGGVVLYETDNTTNSNDRNIESKTQLGRLTSQLQQISSSPLIIAVDQEGGKIQRLKPSHGFESYPSHLELAKTGSPENTEEVAGRIGEELKESGINLNFGPVTDVMVNKNSMIISRMYRSFSNDPDMVYEHAKAYINGLHEQGVISVVKHFPGFGSETGKKYNGMYDISSTWSEKELEPYKQLFADNDVTVDAVMVSHVYNQNLDTSYPASLSEKVITDLLREELGYNGVIIGESPQAVFISEEYGLENAIRQQVKAGVDMLQFANNIVYDEDIAAKTIDIIKDMVESGEITEAQINASYERIQQMKSKL